MSLENGVHTKTGDSTTMSMSDDYHACPILSIKNWVGYRLHLKSNRLP